MIRIRYRLTKVIPMSPLYRIRLFVYVAMLLPAASNVAAQDRPNVLLLCVDDLRPELRCFGKDYIISPNIDSLAASGRAFHRHYVQAPTCGAVSLHLANGQVRCRGQWSIVRARKKMSKNPDSVPPSMPAWFRQHGFTTVSVGKVSHHPGGRGGADWDDDDQPEMPMSWDRHLLPAGPWQHPRGAMHGLAHGEIRGNAKAMDVFQAVEGTDSIYPDGLITDESLHQLDLLVAVKGKPFFLAVGIIRPHLPFGAPAKYLEQYRDVNLPPIPHPQKPSGKTTWHSSGEFMKYNRWNRNPNTDAEFATEVRRHYAACVTYADAQIGRVIERLESLGARENTIIVLWGDHGWHLGEHAIWGKHALFEESLRSPLIISYNGIVAPGQPSDSVVETLDIFPTLCDLAGLPIPEFAQGETLRPILDDPDAPGHAAISYAGDRRTIRTETHRLIAHKDGFAELYDHTSAQQETRNLADDQPELVKQLLARLGSRLP